MRLTFIQYLNERLSKEQTPGTSDLKPSGNIEIAGSSPRKVNAPKGSEVVSGVSPEVLFGKKRQKK